MDKTTKASFLTAYANLPVGSRGEIIVVVNGIPLTWNSLRLEVDAETELAVAALNKLAEMGILLGRAE